MKVMHYPEMLSKRCPIFLGGSTSKGDWQALVQEAFADTDAVFVNTCRPDWDVREPTREEKNDHIAWEFDMLDRCSVTFICIPENASKSPTVLLELGIAITKSIGSVVVYIHPSYSHYNNAVIACEQALVTPYVDFDEAVKKLKDLFLTSPYF